MTKKHGKKLPSMQRVINKNAPLSLTGLEESTRPLVFMNASGSRASENFDDFQCKLFFFPYMPLISVPILTCYQLISIHN